MAEAVYQLCAVTTSLAGVMLCHRLRTVFWPEICLLGTSQVITPRRTAYNTSSAVLCTSSF